VNQALSKDVPCQIFVWTPRFRLTCVFRSWLLLFGFLPVDYDDVGFEWIEPGRGFRECSTMLSQRRWIHERRIEPAGGGCRVIDRIRFEPRVPGLVWLFRPIFHRTFLRRHRRLREAFGGR
jgi:hypothetical protein